MGTNSIRHSIHPIYTMKRKTLLALAIGATFSTALNVQAVTIDFGGRGELDEIGFTVDFGSVSFVSDLSAGGLRFNPVTAGGTQIINDELLVTTESELKFDWSVVDESSSTEESVYQILPLNPTVISFHNGADTGITNGSVSRQIGPGSYQLQIRTVFEGFSIPNYDLTISDLEVNPVSQIPDSPLGLWGIASILAILGIHRRLASRGR